MTRPALSRRSFLAALAALLAGPGRGLAAQAAPLRPPPRHPEPRPGIDASRVLRREQLTEHPDAGAVFDLVREIPAVVDGVRCHCGCSELEGFYSLLSCFEREGMAEHCLVCQGEARLVHRLHRSGKSLAAIRAAVDAQFGAP